MLPRRLEEPRLLAGIGIGLIGLVLIACFLSVEDRWITTPLFGSVMLARVWGAALGAGLLCAGFFHARGARAALRVLEWLGMAWVVFVMLPGCLVISWWLKACLWVCYLLGPISYLVTRRKPHE